MRLRSAYGNLSVRERLLVTGAGGLILLALVWLLLVNPVLAMADNTEQRAATADQQLHVMQRLRDDFDEIHHRLSTVERRIAEGPRGNLRSTLEALASAGGVKVDSMEPQSSPAHETYRETKVEVGLKNVTLAQMVDYLERIEGAPQVLSIKALRVRTRSDDSEMLDVTFTVSSFERL
jgi:type II secretory pathway component PulM